MAKAAFTASDIAAIRRRLADDPAYAAAVALAPTSPIAAQIMREVGVSEEKIRQAYAAARKAAGIK